VVLGAALVGATALGLGLGHELWPGTTSAVSSAQGSTTSPGSSGSSGSSGSGSSGQNGSSSGQSPFGSSGSGGDFGQSPFGSLGGGSSSGQSPFGSFGSGGSGSGSSGSGNSGSGSSGSSGSGSTSETDAIAAKVAPALVDINSTFGYQSAQGAGTGIVLTSNGEVITNNHVINGATKISVTDIGNGKTYNASVVGYDAAHDVAVLQLQGASGLQTAKLGNSSQAAVGESVVAIGNAGGTGGTPSNAGGSITALNQSITAGDDLDGTSEQLSGLIETDANIQPGDSGGSLVDTAGEVIGIDTAASQGFSFQSSGNQGFAIPINAAVAIAHQIESGQGSTTTHVGPTAFLGVGLSSSSNQGSSGGLFGGSANGSGGSNSSGATVGNVVSGGPAAQAGLAAGDIITSFDGQTVDSSSTISALMVGHHPGDKVQVSWVDSSGQSHTATVDLGTGPPA
jgi:S1-C subfamily serine protease